MRSGGRHENEQHLHRPRGGGDRQPAVGDGRGRRSGLPRVYPLPQCQTPTNSLGNSHRRTEHIRPEHQQGGPPGRGPSRASAADEAATCGSVSAFAVAVLTLWSVAPVLAAHAQIVDSEAVASEGGSLVFHLIARIVRLPYCRSNSHAFAVRRLRATRTGRVWASHCSDLAFPDRRLGGLGYLSVTAWIL
jgi:hypothetical protein